ncbi:MAG: hypothetical protein CVU84_11835 [Firmicutes bacterium HGW-Firmicutes-1]|jgi:hypothetical protein|nr:MAG: hypothetical protein CVU84_11835 [Firmicutes bacterium HGW-Firmicutes-1]
MTRKKKIGYAKVLLCSILIMISFANIQVDAQSGIGVRVNGVAVVFKDTKAFINNNNYALAPVRELCEALGARVKWNGALKQITITNEEKTIILTINQKTALVDGKEISLKTQAVLKNNKTLVPIKFITDTLNHKAEWKQKSQMIDITAQPLYNHYRGQLHSHTGVSDGYGEVEEAYKWAKEKGNVDFFAVTDHSNLFDNGDEATFESHNSEEWALMKKTADEYNEDGEFIAIAGYELTYWDKVSGHMNTYNTEGFYSRRSIELEPYYEKLEKEVDSFSQFNHPGTTWGDFQDFGFYSKERDDVIHLFEVGNGPGKQLNSDYWRCDGYYFKALDKGWHVAPTNGQDNHNRDWVTTNPFRTVILAKDLTREALFDAIREHRVYAAEDKNVEVNYTLNGYVMGSEITDSVNQLNIYIGVKDPDVADKVQDITIYTNGGKIVDYKTFNSNNINYQVSLAPKAEQSYYYVRIRQKDNNYIITAPIWIDK